MTTTDRTGADTATFEAEMARLDRLEVADVAADVIGDVLHKWMGGDRDYHDAPALAVLASHKPAPGTGTETCTREHCDRLCRQTLAERDHLEDIADRLAAAIAPPEVLGEHSSGNNPWMNALDYAEANSLPAPGADSSGQAVQRVQGVIDWLSTAEWIPGVSASLATTIAVRRLRAAVAGTQRGHDEEGGQ